MEMMLLNAGTTDWEALGAGMEAMEDLEGQESGETATIPRPKILSAPLAQLPWKPSPQGSLLLQHSLSIQSLRRKNLVG